MTDNTARMDLSYDPFAAVNGTATTIKSGDTWPAQPNMAVNLDLAADTGRIVGKTESIAGASVNYAYTYDALGRLTGVARDNTAVESYSYDANGRRTAGNGRIHTYDADDRLTQTASGGTTIDYTYAPEGWRTGKTIHSAGEGEAVTDQTDYLYTAAGQLAAITLHAGDADRERGIAYQYNLLGQRIAKQIDGVTEEKYLWAGMNMGLLAVYDGTDQLKARFEYAGGRMPVAMEQVQGGTPGRYYLTYDQVGSLRAVFDTGGNLVHTVEYDAFGNILSETAASGYEDLCIPFGFAGGLHDRDTDLVLFGFRNYDPETGRWISKDPIGLAGGSTNVYEYCGNDPVNFFDPNGLEPFNYAIEDWSYYPGLTNDEAIQAADDYGYIADGALQGGMVVLDTINPMGLLSDYFPRLKKWNKTFKSLGYYNDCDPGIGASQTAASIGSWAYLSVITGGFALAPRTKAVQEVVRWGGEIGSGSFVMTGGASFRNALMAGKPWLYFTTKPTIATLERSVLTYPRTVGEWWKGLLGQRQVLGLFSFISPPSGNGGTSATYCS